jgi:Vitamin K-dependent gamma-carboxylase
MRRLLNPVFRYLEESAQATAEGWNAFWFTPADPTLLGVLRVLTGLMLLYTHAVWGLVLGDFFGPESWLSERLVRTLQEGSYIYSFWWFVPQDWIWPAWGLSMLVLALFTFGVWTRVTSILALVVTLSFAHRVPAATFGLDQINAMLALYLAIGPSGAALSLDRWLTVRRSRAAALQPAPSEGANLALRLINVHMCVIYFFAGISKLQGPAWWNGEAMWRAFSNLEYQSIDMTWLAWHPRLLEFMTHVSVLWEVSFCALIWVPRLRPLVLALGVALHVGIGACLGMWTFGLIMLVGCASFLPTDAVRRLVEAWLPGRARSTPGMRPFSATSERAVYPNDRHEAMEPVLSATEAE